MTDRKSDAVELATFQVTLQHLTTIVEKLNESLEGTAKTPGLKEKMVIAQYNIEANKQAYREVLEEVGRVEERLGKSMTQAILRIEEHINLQFDALKANDEKLRNESHDQETRMQKIQPWINGIAWFVTVAGGILLSLLLSGKLHLAP